MNLHQLKKLNHHITPWLKPLQWTRSFPWGKIPYLEGPKRVIQRTRSKSKKGDIAAGKTAQWVKVLATKSDDSNFISQTYTGVRITPTNCHLTSMSAWQVCASLQIHCSTDDVLSSFITFFTVCGSHLTFKSVLFGHCPKWTLWIHSPQKGYTKGEDKWEHALDLWTEWWAWGLIKRLLSGRWYRSFSFYFSRKKWT